MTGLVVASVGVCLAGLAVHILSTALTLWRLRNGRLAAREPPVTIIRPVRGLDTYDELTLRSGFQLNYPNYELIHCCEDAGDPAAALVRRLIRAHPAVEARLLIGEDRSTANPKLNNIIKGWHAARYDWIVMADCNVLMPADYIQRLLAPWDERTGLVCSPPIGSAPDGFGAELECAFLNTYQARWQYTGECIGLGFAQGKNMLWRRDVLESAGGILVLGTDLAEDAASTKLVRKRGLAVRVVDRPFEQPLGRRTAGQVWDRQVRWARLRRATFPHFYLPEVLNGSLWPVLSGAYAAAALDLDIAAVVAGIAVIWFGCEATLARSAGWHLSAWSPLAWVMRDLLLPVIWLQGWLGHSFSWRGNEMRTPRYTIGSVRRARATDR